MEPDPVLALVGVTTGYRRGNPVLRDVDLTLDQPGLYRLRGPNGSGKSTLVEVVAGHLAPWTGRVTVLSLPAADPRVRPHRRVCRTDDTLHPRMTVGEHLSLTATAWGTDPSALRARADRYGLRPWWDERAENLSTGNARKLWILVTTGGGADLVLLDEPFNGLDADGCTVLHEELRDWARRAVVLVASHQDLPGATTIDLDTADRDDGGPPPGAPSTTGVPGPRERAVR